MLKTASGFEYVIDQDALDDWELMNSMAEMTEMENSDNPLKMVPLFDRILDKLLGSEQYNKLKDHLKAKDGKVKTSAIIEDFNSIMTGADLKKS